MAQINFSAAKLLSDCRPARIPNGIEWVPIEPLPSAEAYSDFILRHLADYVPTSHCLLVQWDGHVIDAGHWRSEFLDYDYIGARWPQFSDGRDVGNGGFSLRSRALLKACRDPGFSPSHPEDIAIGRRNRTWLEAEGLRIAPREMADAFSAERTGNPAISFGYHGIWHMPHVLGCSAFWQIYLSLDERGNIRRDFRRLLSQVVQGRGGASRAWRLVRDLIVVYANRRKAAQ